MIPGWSSALAQAAPLSPDRPWAPAAELRIDTDLRPVATARFSIEGSKTYGLAELIDLAESHNPETRAAWEQARAQAGALGVARSELYPTLAVAALSQTSRSRILVAERFVRETLQEFGAVLNLNYTIFDFGARAGRVDAASAQVLAANFAFNDAHRAVISRVEQVYYRLLNTIGQGDAVRASLANAQAVQQAAEERLDQGLATMPDVLEARSATAQADYDLQAVVGAEQIARGNLATAIGAAATAAIRVQSLDRVTVPDSIGETVEQAIDRALAQRPDLLQQVADLRSTRARVKEARAASYPALSLDASPAIASLYGVQRPAPWEHTTDLVGGVSLSLEWPVFDGGARRNRLAQARADVGAAEAQTSGLRNQIGDEVWTAYANLTTAFRQRLAATTLLESADQSYASALEAYNYGLRNLLDVTAAQRTLAQARSAEVLARTQVLSALANLAFRTGDAIQSNRARARR
ncbi:MAG TPA: TolC family protein [Gemmatimonadales bacterium]